MLAIRSYYRARYYDPATGHFLGEDPIGFDGGINAYRYVSNSPVRLADPFGMQQISPSSIKQDENAALNIMARPNCLNFILNTIKKTFDYLNNRALERGFSASPSTLKAQRQATDMARFAMTLLVSEISISNRYPDYGAHVPFAGGWTIYIDLGYAGPIDLVHETFHLAPYGFSDIDLANALGAQYAIDPRNPQKTTENASTAWNCLLERACK